MRLILGLLLSTVPLVACSDESGAPEWFAERSELDSCGVDSLLPGESTDPEARACFSAAYEAGTAAEYTLVTYGDEGTTLTAHFRILSADSYEIVAETDASDVSPDKDGWRRWDCDRFLFQEGIGNDELGGQPLINQAGECTLVETVDA